MAGIVGPLVEFVAEAAFFYALNRVFAPRAETQIFSPKFSDNQVTTRSAVEPRAVVYGEFISSGPLVFAAVNGANNRYLHTVIPLMETECEDIGTVFFDDFEAFGPEFNKLHIVKIYWHTYPAGGDILIQGELFSGFATSTPGSGSHRRIRQISQTTVALYGLIVAHPSYAGWPFTAALTDVGTDGPMSLTLTAKSLQTKFTVSWKRPPSDPSTHDGISDDYSINGVIDVLVTGKIFELFEHTGASGQAADANLIAENVGWTTDHRLRGVAYVYSKLEYIEERWPFGIPNIKAVTKGRKGIYDPRSALTGWTNNPALCIRDYLTAPESIGMNARWGGADTEIDEASFIAAANICDEYVLARPATSIVASTVANPTVIESAGHGLFSGDEVVIAGHAGSVPDINGNHTVTKVDDDHVSISVNVTTGGTGGTLQMRQKRYTCNGRSTLDKLPRQIIDELKSSCQGQLVYAEGKYKLFVAAYQSPVMDLDEDDLRAPLSVTIRPARRDLINAVRGKYFDKNRFWQETDFPTYRDVIYKADDGGEEIPADVSLPFTTDPYTAQRLAKIIVERARATLVSFPAKLRALQLEVNDRVRLSIAHLGWTLKVFRVVATSYSADGNVDLALAFDDPSMYAWDPSDAIVIDPPPDLSLPNPYTTDPPTDLSVTEELYETTNGQGIQSRLIVTWKPSPDSSTVGYYVSYFGASEKDAATAITPGLVWSPLITDTLSYQSPDVVPGVYFVSVYATDRNGVLSEELGPFEIEVFGKTLPPPDVTGFICAQNGNVVVFRWDQVSDIDLDGYDIRYGPLGSSWADGTPLTEIEKGTHITSASVPPGNWRTMIKAKDTVGNYSTNEAACNIEVISEMDVIAQQEQAPDWPGTLTNFVRHWTGVLIPDDQNPASDYADASNTWATTFVPTPYVLCSYEAAEFDIGFDDDARVWGPIESALGPGVTAGKADPRLQIDHHLAAGAYDGFEEWTIGTVRARYIKHKLVLDTSIGKAKVTGFLPTVDQIEDTVSVSGVVIASGGTTVNFPDPFHNVPNVIATPQSTAARYVVISSVTSTGFFAKVFDGTGADVGGTINYDATGV